MRASNFYRNLAIGLALLNVGVLLVMYLNRPRGHHHPPDPNSKNFRLPPRLLQILEDEDPAWQETFRASLRRQHANMEQLNEQKARVIRELFGDLTGKEGVSAAERAELLREIETIEAERIRSTYQHLTEVYALCPTDKRADCEAYLADNLNRMLLSRKKMRPPPRD